MRAVRIRAHHLHRRAPTSRVCALQPVGHVNAWSVVRGAGKLELAGELRLADAKPIWRSLCALAREPAPKLDLDLSRAVLVDGAVMSLLAELRTSLVARGVPSEIVGASPFLQPIVHLYGGDALVHPHAREPRDGAIARIGAAMQRLFARFTGAIGFLGAMVSALGTIVRRPSTANWGSIPSHVSRAGADGMLIVIVLNFLVGFVMAFQAARQLEIYGANIYVADIVGISVTRELAPLMTAIIMSGRSGAAFAAELGTMRVSEEIDALQTMGFAPMPYLILPRIWALAIAAPVLTLLGDIFGVLGGLSVASASLDVSARSYVFELQKALVLSDVWTGLVKSIAFGSIIGFIGCQQGFVARGAAAGVGRGTTATVVYCLFALVIVDTLFTILFRGLGV